MISGSLVQLRTYAGRAFVISFLFVGFASAVTAQSAVSNPHPKSVSPSRAAPAGNRKDVARFASRVRSALNEASAAKASWGILVVDRDTGETLYELNADRFFTPASNAKVFTTSLALATLGPDFKFRTTLESSAKLSSDGHLGGDLRLVGRGDPDLSNRQFPFSGKVERDGPVDKILAEMADEAVAKGLKEVDGDIVADDSYYPYDPYPPGWAIGDVFFTFGSPIGAIAFNDNCIFVTILPGAKVGDPANVVVEPAAATDTFSRRIFTVDADAKPEVGVVRQPGPEFLLLQGAMPLGHAPLKLDLAMPDPAETAALAMKQIFESRGVRVTGTVRVNHAAPPEIYPDAPVVLGPLPVPAAPNTNVLAEHLSLPLIESVRLTNKVSQNLHAELLLRAVAHEKKGFGVTDAGLWAEQDFLKSIGVADGDVVLSDGSGLARDDLVTPRATVQLLRFDDKQPWGPAYISTLPISGVDGTLENRMQGTSAAGRIEAKTGSLDHVHSLSGFATTLGGERLVFSIFENNNPQHAREAAAGFDSIAVAMIETLGVKAPPPQAHQKHK
ncbi:MAG TPA: D-alanyl-D-alanine carboxypeptidase/D-alanyl-D-alanine-endopeptidase [Candidatus Acidoferrales bacterium]